MVRLYVGHRLRVSLLFSPPNSGRISLLDSLTTARPITVEGTITRGGLVLEVFDDSHLTYWISYTHVVSLLSNTKVCSGCENWREETIMGRYRSVYGCWQQNLCIQSLLPTRIITR